MEHQRTGGCLLLVSFAPDLSNRHRARSEPKRWQLFGKQKVLYISVKGPQHRLVHFPQKIRGGVCTKHALRRRNENSIRHWFDPHSPYAHWTARVISSLVQDELGGFEVVFAKQSFC